MSEAKFTPGPWVATTFVDNRPHGSDHHTFKVTPQRGPYGTLFAADAHLIAAAPELYELLRKTAEMFDMHKGIEDDEYIYRQEVRSILAKARGVTE